MWLGHTNLFISFWQIFPLYHYKMHLSIFSNIYLAVFIFFIITKLWQLFLLNICTEYGCFIHSLPLCFMYLNVSVFLTFNLIIIYLSLYWPLGFLFDTFSFLFLNFYTFHFSNVIFTIHFHPIYLFIAHSFYYF